MGTPAYSFRDVQCTINGPNGSFSLGSGSGDAEEGITFEASEDQDTMTIGADGTPMHSLHADISGKATVRLLKTSSVNASLSQMMASDMQSSSTWGQNNIALTNTQFGDDIQATDVAFTRRPPLTYAKDGGYIEWVFNCGRIPQMLIGSGAPAS